MKSSTLSPEISTAEAITEKVIVSSHNEWDVLEEVIVGTIEGASIPFYDCVVKAGVPEQHALFFKNFAGSFFPENIIKKAALELEEFVQILEAEGVTVRRPEKLSHDKPFSTPDWQSPGGLYQAMPRDLLLVIGDEIIESPMAWRSRYFEINAYRPLLKEYFLQGAKWSAAPKPQLSDDLYCQNYVETDLENAPWSDCPYAINEFEPTFDAADFIRCGRDIFVQKSNVTNSIGIEWLRRHLGKDYKIHLLQFKDSHPMHIDGTFMPLAPGHLLVNPERVLKIPEMFKSWNIMYAPPSTTPPTHPLYMSSSWLCMNVFMLDEKRVMVERQEEPLIQLLKKNGFTPILCNFRNFYSFGGGFHCATLDMRRQGCLQSYF